MNRIFNKNSFISRSLALILTLTTLVVGGKHLGKTFETKTALANEFDNEQSIDNLEETMIISSQDDYFEEEYIEEIQNIDLFEANVWRNSELARDYAINISDGEVEGFCYGITCEYLSEETILSLAFNGLTATNDVIEKVTSFVTKNNIMESSTGNIYPYTMPSEQDNYLMSLISKAKLYLNNNSTDTKDCIQEIVDYINNVEYLSIGATLITRPLLNDEQGTGLLDRALNSGIITNEEYNKYKEQLANKLSTQIFADFNSRYDCTYINTIN